MTKTYVVTTYYCELSGPYPSDEELIPYGEQYAMTRQQFSQDKDHNGLDQATEFFIEEIDQVDVGCVQLWESKGNSWKEIGKYNV